jgi:hypothetical protein
MEEPDEYRVAHVRRARGLMIIERRGMTNTSKLAVK